jgi:hypothetical protein
MLLLTQNKLVANSHKPKFTCIGALTNNQHNIAVNTLPLLDVGCLWEPSSIIPVK